MEQNLEPSSEAFISRCCSHSYRNVFRSVAASTIVCQLSGKEEGEKIRFFQINPLKKLLSEDISGVNGAMEKEESEREVRKVWPKKRPNRELLQPQTCLRRGPNGVIKGDASRHFLPLPRRIISLSHFSLSLPNYPTGSMLKTFAARNISGFSSSSSSVVCSLPSDVEVQ